MEIVFLPPVFSFHTASTANSRWAWNYRVDRARSTSGSCKIQCGRKTTQPAVLGKNQQCHIISHRFALRILEAYTPNGI